MTFLYIIDYPLGYIMEKTPQSAHYPSYLLQSVDSYTLQIIDTVRVRICRAIAVDGSPLRLIL
jgi:hypothetical protein